MHKKVLTILLALCMVAACLSVSASAAQGPTTIKTAEALKNALGGDEYAKIEGNVVKLTKNTNKLTADILWAGSGVTLDVGDYTLDLRGGQENLNTLLGLYADKGGTADLTITGTEKGKIVTKGYYPTIEIHGSSTLKIEGKLTIENEYEDPNGDGLSDDQKQVIGVAINVAKDYRSQEEADELNKAQGQTGIITAQDAIPKTVEINGATVKGVRAISVDDGSTLTIEDGKFESSVSSLDAGTVTLLNGSNATIKGGTFTGKCIAVDVVDSNLNITGGKFEATEDYKNSDKKGDVTSSAIYAFNFEGKTSEINISGDDTVIEGKYSGVSAFYEGTKVNISGGKITGEETGVYAGNKSTIEVSEKAEVEGRYGAIAYAGGHLEIKGGKVNGTTAGLGTNGSDATDSGTTINVTGGTVSSKEGVGAYLPAGKMTVSGGSISGQAGIVVRGGDLDVQGGTIESTATGDNQTVTVGDAKDAEGKQYSVPAAGITVDIDAEYPAQKEEGQKHVTIGEDATIKAAEGGKTLAACESDGKAVEPVEGTEKVDPEKNPFNIAGGTFTTGDEETADTENVSPFLADGYEYTEDDKIEYTSENPAAELDGVKYGSLEDALARAQSKDTIKLIGDVTLSSSARANTNKAPVTVTKEVTIDLNGHTITATDEAAFNVGDDNGDSTGNLTITGEGTITSSAAKPTIRVKPGSTLTVESGVIENTNEDSTTGAIQAKGASEKKATVVINGGTVTGANYGIAGFAYSDITVSGGAVTGTNTYGIATNGSTSGGNDGQSATVTVTGGSITGGEAGMYLPSQGGKTTVSGDATITGTNGAGIVVRGGSIEVKADDDGNIPTIVAGGTDNQTYGDDEDALPPAALVVDKDGYGGQAKATIEDGKFEAETNIDAVVLTDGATPDTDNTDDKLNVKGGYFSKAVDKAYLDESLNAQLKSDDENTPYSYYTSMVEAEKAQAELGGIATPLDEDAADFVAVGFIGTGVSNEDSNKILNDAIKAAFPDAKTEITDSTDEVFWAIFKAAKEDAESGKKYTVEFSSKDGKKFKQSVNEAKLGGIVYFTPDYQEGNEEQTNKLDTLAPGEYTVTLTPDQGTTVSTATIEVYQVNYVVPAKLLADNSEAQTTTTYTADPDSVTAPTVEDVPSGKQIKWGEPVSSEDGYTLTYTAELEDIPSSPSIPSAPTTAKVEKTENGSVKLSSTTARAGQTVTITPKADKGYEVDEITVTDKNGEAVEVKKNEDGTYSFTMPTATPVTVKVTFSKIDPAVTFVDVAEDAEDWYLDELLELMVEHPGLINGDYNNDGERVFRPHDSMTRAEFAKIVFVMAGGEAVDIENPFTDMDEGDWYYDYILWACSEGIMGGNGDGTVTPEENITRDQAVAMLHRWAGEPEAEDDTVLDSFPDAAEVEDYAAVAMAWAVEAGVIQGDDTGSINPTDDIQRCEMVAILVRCLDTVAAE